MPTTERVAKKKFEFANEIKRLRDIFILDRYADLVRRTLFARNKK